GSSHSKTLGSTQKEKVVASSMGQMLKRVQHDKKKKVAFTLAEVLITLGIIGVVAALTLPALMQNYRNHVVEARLKKFYTTFNQAIKLAEVEHGDKKYWYLDARGVELDDNNNPIESTSEIDKWFTKYLSQYIVYKKVIKTNGCVLYYLPDGSAFQFGVIGNPSLRDIYFFPNGPERCDVTNYDELHVLGGACVFSFEYRPNSNNPDWIELYDKGLEPAKFNWDGTVQKLKYDGFRGCYASSGNHAYCTALIQLNGWKIPKDYPWKVH
ncbi:MAG: type II secretion system protein, partial [Candidatus Gastranaerophilaceae bacterium]|nr:type II secretion system protein [Candidatus Gastranaerophilaceae bacterium]